jgi:SET domain-containing protein
VRFDCRAGQAESSKGSHAETNKMTLKQADYTVKRTATGLGLFALKAIPKGRRIIEYTGPLISNEEVERRKTGKYFFGVNTKWSIDGSPRSNIARYINHSCRPNAEALVSGHRVWVWSRKNIKAGEEITFDYGKEYFDDHIKPVGCKCKKCAAPTPAKGAPKP